MVAADLAEQGHDLGCKYEQLDVTDGKRYADLVQQHGITYIVHLAAIVSSLGEKHPDLCYSVNIDGTKNALDLARDHKCQLFVPSSIASFGGDNFRKVNTPNDEI